jgi:hypothetical protein
MKKLKKLSEKPEWFDISKYDKATTLGLEEWYMQIEIRALLPEPIDLDLEESESPDGDFRIKHWLTQIKIDPIFENKGIVIPDDLRDLDCSYPDSEAWSPVRNFKVSDLRGINRALKIAADGEELIAYCKGEPSDKTPMDLKTSINLGNKAVHLLSGVHRWILTHDVALTANLQASDEQLILEFKSWLKQARIDLGYNSTSEKMFSYIDFKDWCKYAILPYFDLTTWAKFHKLEFTHSLMSELIFPNAGIEGFNGDDRVKRETRRRSAEIFNFKTVDALRAQVRKRENLKKSV